MKPSTYKPNKGSGGSTSHQHGTSTGTADVKTLSLDSSTSAILLSVETNDARVTFDGTTPSATNGHIFPKSAIPALLAVGPATAIKWISTAAGDSTVQISEWT